MTIVRRRRQPSGPGQSTPDQNSKPSKSQAKTQVFEPHADRPAALRRGKPGGIAPARPRKSTRPPGTVRLQRVMAEAGIASRRTCEAIIEAGRVRVNGQTCSRLPVIVDPRRDRIEVDGRSLSSWIEPDDSPARTERNSDGGKPAPGRDRGGHRETPVRARRVYVMVFKTARMLTTTHDDAGRATIMDLVKHPSGVRLFPVGRLDFDSTGLVLLTNDGELTHRLTHARFGIEKTYEVVVKGVVTPETLEAVRSKLADRTPGRGSARAASARSAPATGPFLSVDVADSDATRTILRVVVRGSERSLVESRDPTGRARADTFRNRGTGWGGGAGRRQAGPERERGGPGRSDGGGMEDGGGGAGGGGLLREVLGRLGHPVKKLVRVGLGPLELTDIGTGQWRELTRDEVRALRRAVGLGGSARSNRAGRGADASSSRTAARSASDIAGETE